MLSDVKRAVIGKIRMRLTAIGAPVAVKHRTVEPVNKVRILPVYILLVNKNL
jgi:hypothetical protein